MIAEYSCQLRLNSACKYSRDFSMGSSTKKKKEKKKDFQVLPPLVLSLLL